MWPFSSKKRETSRSREVLNTAPRTDVTLASNAPAYWPAVVMRAVYPSSGGLRSMNTLLFSGAVAKALQGHEDWLRLEALAQQKLLEDGVLHVPMVLNDQGVSRDLFFYPEATLDNARHFAGLEELYARLGKPAPIWFCPEPLNQGEVPAAAAPPLRAFDFDLLGRHKGALPPGEYAMWWQTPEEPAFMESNAVHELDRIYRAMDGIESYLAAALLRALDKRKYVDTFRVDLPEEPLTLPLKGPDGNVMVAELSRDKGMRLLFPMETTTATHRDRFLALYGDYVETWRRKIREKDLPMDSPQQQCGLRWWQQMKSTISNLENSGELLDTLARLEV